MVHTAAKTLGLVISAIRNLCERKGSTSREILKYISSIYDIPSKVARRQMQTALKRGVAFGILRKNGGHYILPTADIKRQEAAVQDLDLIDLSEKSSRRGRCKCKPKRRRRKSGCSKSSCSRRRHRSRRRRRRSKRGCKCKPKKRDATEKSPTPKSRMNEISPTEPGPNTNFENEEFSSTTSLSSVEN